MDKNNRAGPLKREFTASSRKKQCATTFNCAPTTEEGFRFQELCRLAEYITERHPGAMAAGGSMGCNIVDVAIAVIDALGAEACRPIDEVEVRQSLTRLMRDGAIGPLAEVG